MKLANPVKDFIPKIYPLGDVTQWFGENKELYSTRVCSGTTCLQGHNGIDIVRQHGTPLLSVCNGRVVEVKDSPNGYGKHIRILGEGYEFVYGHLSRIDCTIGQEVKRGEQVGLMGNTGFTVSGDTPFWKNNPFAGTHLHLGRRPVEPWNGTGTYNISYTTGERGNIPNYPGDFLGSVPITANDFETVPNKDAEVKDIIDTIAILHKESEKTQDVSVKTGFAKAVENLLRMLKSLVS